MLSQSSIYYTKEKSSVSYETKEREEKEREEKEKEKRKDTSSAVLKDTSSAVLDTKDPVDFATIKNIVKGQITKLFDVIEKDSSLSVEIAYSDKTFMDFKNYVPSDKELYETKLSYWMFNYYADWIMTEYKEGNLDYNKKLVQPKLSLLLANDTRRNSLIEFANEKSNEVSKEDVMALKKEAIKKKEELRRIIIQVKNHKEFDRVSKVMNYTTTYFINTCDIEILTKWMKGFKILLGDEVIEEPVIETKPALTIVKDNYFDYKETNSEYDEPSNEREVPYGKARISGYSNLY